MMRNAGDNPYVGPRTFEEPDAEYFFGRELEAQALTSLVLGNRLVLFYATSGAGKSSLINTRLVPALREQKFTPLRGRVSMGQHPQSRVSAENVFVFNLLSALDPEAEPVRLANYALSEYLSSHHPVVDLADDDFLEPARILIIDQFEELFTTNEAHWQQREAFFRQLAAAMADDRLLWVLLVMREDYVSSLDRYAHLMPNKLRVRYHMARMRGEAALEAIKAPAEKAGRPFEPPGGRDPGAAEMLLRDLQQVRVVGSEGTVTGEFVEPVQLQLVCYSLWEALRADPGPTITAEDIKAAADVDKTLGAYYDNAIGTIVRETGVDEQALRDLFGQDLITETNTRGLVFRGDRQTEGIDNEVIDFLDNNFFLLRSMTIGGGQWYELVHDRFIPAIRQSNDRAWMRLERERQQAATRVQLEAQKREESQKWRRRMLVFVVPLIVLLTVLAMTLLALQNRDLQQANGEAEANLSTAAALATQRSDLLEQQRSSLVEQSTRLSQSQATQVALVAALNAAASNSGGDAAVPTLDPTIVLREAQQAEGDLVEQIAAVEARQTAVAGEIVVKPGVESTTTPTPGATLIASGLVAFSCGSAGESRIYVHALETGEQFVMPGQPGNSRVPVFSPDGKRIAYRSNAGGTWQIYSSDLAGNNLRQLTTGPSNNYEPSWSPDGSQFAFVSDRRGSKNIYVMNEDRRWYSITDGGSINDDPTWSSDGFIAFESNERGRYNIHIARASGGGARVLISQGDASTTPAWSPEATQIAFESRSDGVGDIWIADRDGGNPRQVTSGGAENRRPAWAPDSAWLAFSSNRDQDDSNRFDIWIVELETGRLERLTSRGDCSDPAWGSGELPEQEEQTGTTGEPSPAPCDLAIGSTVTAKADARLWSSPDVLAGTLTRTLAEGDAVRVLNGPESGRIRTDAPIDGEWWEVERISDGVSGWLWESRIEACAAP